jgi:tRNA dimethylallyltransferase
MDDRLALDEQAVSRAHERTVIGTRRYVRRQRSWFGRDHRIRWIDTDTDGRADDAASPLETALDLLGEAGR